MYSTNLTLIKLFSFLIIVNIAVLSVLGLAKTLALPLFFAYIIAIIIFILMSQFNQDKFIPKIYLITCLFHFLAGLFIQILKYHILHLPATDGFAGVGIDNDGCVYHGQALDMLKSGINTENCYLFSIIITVIYRLSGINEYAACLFNCLLSGGISVIIYKMACSIYRKSKLCKIIAYITAFSFSVAAYTTVLMRDVYIFLLAYMIIYYYSVFYKKMNFLYLIFCLLSFIALCFFRAYAAGAALSACLSAHLINVSYIKIKKSKIFMNKYMIITIISIIVLIALCIIYQKFLRIDYIISLFDMETILKVSEVGYGGANSSFGVDRIALSKCLPVFLLFGYFCMFFAPFPHQWLLSRNIVQAFSASETIILYIFLIPSFFIGIRRGFREKNFTVMASFLYILFIFTFYGMILDNSGAVFRGRAPFIPLIYLIAVYEPGGLLKKILDKILKIKIV